VRYRGHRWSTSSVVLAIGLLAGCRAGKATQSPKRDAVSSTPSRDVSSEPAGSDLVAFSWERVLLLGWRQVAGPGVASVAQVGRQLSVLAPDGEIWTASVVYVSDWEDEPPSDACLYTVVAFGDDPDDDTHRPPPVRWNEPGATEERPGEDIATLGVHLVVELGTAVPRPVPHVLEVHYANALCEAGADADAYVLVKPYSSTAPDPLADAPFLEKRRHFPRRIVTLRTLDRTLHFVTISMVDAPSSGRMSDIAGRYQTALWIVEEKEGGGLEVLHDELHDSGRSINVDTSCQLPLRYPTPWGVVELGGTVYVLTRSNLNDFERWALHPNGITREGGWTANFMEYG
jgi:hypothetical protein